jgi:prepilin-type processing-associated H-X9-DG protein
MTEPDRAHFEQYVKHNRLFILGVGFSAAAGIPWFAGSSSYFGSAHNSGCPMVFCDGHVRIIGFYIDRWLFEHLGDRSDGNAVGDF